MSEIRIRVGSTYLHSGGTVVNASSIIFHPQADQLGDAFDAALIKVSYFHMINSEKLIPINWD